MFQLIPDFFAKPIEMHFKTALFYRNNEKYGKNFPQEFYLFLIKKYMKLNRVLDSVLFSYWGGGGHLFGFID